MKKKNIIILGIILLVCICMVLFQLSSFSLFFNNNAHLLEEIDIQSGYSIKIYYVPSDATIQETIVIMKLLNGQESLISKHERYNAFKEYELINSDSLKLLLFNSNMNKELEIFVPLLKGLTQ